MPDRHPVTFTNRLAITKEAVFEPGYHHMSFRPCVVIIHISLVDRHRFERLAQSLHPVPIFWAGCRLKNPRMARFVPLFSAGIFQLMPIVRY